MWGIADRFIQQSVPQERRALAESERRIQRGESPTTGEVREQLTRLVEGALLETTRRRAQDLMEE
jgi:hypothetical protein